ncbi:MAG: hypothetical protein WCK33_08065 [Phycisphaerae bacterium]|jgi:hypothetical protein
MHPVSRLPCHLAIAASLMLPACASDRETPVNAPNNGLDSLQSAGPDASLNAPPTDLAAELKAMTSDQPPLAAGGSLDDLVSRQLAKQEQLRALRETPRASRSPLKPADASPKINPDTQADRSFAIDPAATRRASLAASPPPIEPTALARESSLAWSEAAAQRTPPAMPAADPTPTAPPASTPAPVPASSTSDQVTDLAQRMAAMLREPGTPDRPRIADAVAMATIESLRPGSMADLDTSASKLASSLSPEDRSTLLDARDRLAGRHAQVNEELGKLIGAVTPAPSLAIARAALCTRVTGFGAYAPYASTVFRAGQPIRAIVYIELDRFATRPARDGDQVFADAPIDQQVSVELSQSVSLFQDPGGLLAWHTPAQPITDTSRSKRRDFYLIQRIELPRTLSIGKYNIKVKVKDLVAEAEAEAVIPITIVAQ